MQNRRRAALVLVLALVVGLVPAAVASAAAPEAPPRGQVPAPDLTPFRADPLVGPAATGDLAGGGLALAVAGSFTPPPNADFDLAFDASVDATTRQVVTAAAGIWSDVLATSVPITVDVSMRAMDPGMLGAAGPTRAFYGYDGFPAADVLYPAALANQLAGRDLDPGSPDIELELSTEIAWDSRLDTSIGAGQSMLSVAVHELGHGLGHTSWVRPSGLGWVVNYARDGVTLATAYDRLVATGGGTAITSLTEAQLSSALTSTLRWAGPRGRSANGGTNPRLYSPTTFELGSSVGHLDEATFTTHVMTPFLGRGEVHTSVPALSTSMLADIGWTLTSATGSDSTGSSTTTSTTTTPTTPSTPTTGATEPLTDAQRAEAFVEAVAQDFLGRDATGTELARWRDHLLAGGGRDVVTRTFAFSDEWIGVIVDGLYRSTLGRRADAEGRAHWIQLIRAGRTPAEVASYFYASDEYFRRAGGTNTTWVRDLYAEILGRSADAGGLAFWVDRSGATSRTAVALDFYQSLESRRDRVDHLFRRLLGRAPDGTGWSYWAGVLTSGRDVDLAMFLGASGEYFDRAAARFGR